MVTRSCERLSSPVCVMPLVNWMTDFLPGMSREQIGDRFERRQLAIGVEDIELGVIGGEGRVGVLGDGGFHAGGSGVGQRGELRFLAGKQRRPRRCSAGRGRS